MPDLKGRSLKYLVKYLVGLTESQGAQLTQLSERMNTMTAQFNEAVTGLQADVQHQIQQLADALAQVQAAVAANVADQEARAAAEAALAQGTQSLNALRTALQADDAPATGGDTGGTTDPGTGDVPDEVVLNPQG